MRDKALAARGLVGRRARYAGREWKVVGVAAMTYVLERGPRRVFVLRAEVRFVRGDFTDRNLQ